MQRIHSKQPSRSMSRPTPISIEFAPWSTDVENDDLYLGKLNFDVGAPLITSFQTGKSYSLPQASPDHKFTLSADFVSIEKEAVFRFEFNLIKAFRVLDEHGLVELWQASSDNPRPAKSTFRARGHTWNRESFLIFDFPQSQARFSYFVATEDLCLEIVCDHEPRISYICRAIVATDKLNDR